MRRPKTNRVPRTRAGGEWTEAAFWNFLRSGLRRMSRRWPPIVRLTLRANRRTYHGSNKRQKWEYKCCFCKKWKSAKEVQVDHIRPCGQLKGKSDIATFVTRMFCEPEGLRVLCKLCHQHRTQKGRR